ncbi:MAG: neutral/alkaline non-lysosomal ceramidase N-terminal domain-containing protein [Bacillota bacterium]
MGFQAGVAEVVLAPPAGTPMAGYMARQGPSRGWLDPLVAQALYLEGHRGRAVIVCADLIAVDWDLTRAVRDVLGPGLGVPAAGVMVAASHTHSSYAGVVDRLHVADRPQSDPCLREYTARSLAGVAKLAAMAPENCYLSLGRATVRGVGANRDDPSIPVDPEVTVLALSRQDGSLIAVLVNYACHPTVLGADNLLLSSDFVGPMRRTVQKRLRAAGLGCPPVLYTNGAAGDVSPRFTRRAQTWAEARRMGCLVGIAAATAVLGAEPVKGSLAVACGERDVALPARILDPDDLKHRVAAAESELRRAEQMGRSHGELRRLRTMWEGALVQREMYGRLPVQLTTHLQVLLLGPIALVGVPGELFSCLGLHLKERSPVPATVVVGYANDYLGYIADRDAYAGGAYEVLVSPLAEGSGEILVEQLLRLCEDVYKAAAGVDTGGGRN